MPQEGMDPREQIEQYEKEIHELQTHVKFLEDEIALLRRRLHSAPRQVKILEERLLEAKSEVAKAAGQNDKLVTSLRAEREKIEALREEVEKLTQPPASFGVLIGSNEDGSVDVFTSGRKLRVNVDPSVDRTTFHRGAELILNEGMNVIEVLPQDRVGEVVSVKEILDEDRVIVLGRGDEEMVAVISKAQAEQWLKAAGIPTPPDRPREGEG